VFAWFNAKEAKRVGNELAQMVIQQLPADKQLSAKKLESKKVFILRKMDKEIGDLKAKEKLNAYKIAQLGNTFKWALKDAGYPQDLNDTLTEFLIKRL
jgi:hypothetical protein